MVPGAVGAEDPGVNVPQSQFITEFFSLFPHGKLRLSIQGFRLADRVLRDQILVHSVLRLGAGEQELFTA